MIDIKECEKVEIPQGAMYLGPSTDEFSEGYLELNPFTSLTLHNRLGGIENLTQVDNACVMVVFTSDIGENHKLNPGDVLKIEPEGVWHIHVNPFELPSLTHWYFEGDIRHVIDEIRKGND